MTVQLLFPSVTSAYGVARFRVDQVMLIPLWNTFIPDRLSPCDS